MIQVESRRTFLHGFVLTEAELRRIVESISEQFQKLPEEAIAVTARYTMTFRNGVIADTESLDDVLSQENSGSGQIVRLKLDFDKSRVPYRLKQDTSLTLEFIDADDEDEPRSISVRLLIRGKTRDWVFVTSTIIEERIAKIKRFSFNQIGSKNIFARLLPPIIGLVLLMLFTILPLRTVRGAVGTTLENAWKRGELKDPIQALIMVEKLRDHEMVAAFSSATFLIPMSVLVGLLLILIIFAFCVSRFFPPYNFCWGDYLESFRRKESVRKFILGAVVVGLAISFIGSVMAGLLHHAQ